MYAIIYAIMTEIYQPPTQERFSLTTRVTAALAGLSLMLTGCTASEEQKIPFPEPVEVSQPSGDSIPEASGQFESHYGECDASTSRLYAGTDFALFKARECLEVYEDADIALVNYVLSTEDADKLAADAEAHIKTATGGIINADVVAIPASMDAVGLLDDTIEAGCIDIGNVKEYSSYAAMATMPELKGYDKIVGITNLESCDVDVGGVADPEYDLYSEVFEAADKIKAVNENNDEYEAVVEYEGMQMTKNISNPSLVVAHEALHLFGLGHSGTFSGGGKGKPYGDLGYFVENNTGSSIDLNDFISNGKYREYDGQDVMGQTSGSASDQAFNAPLTYALEWPLREAKMDTQVSAVNITEQPVIFSSEANDASNLAILQLDKPLPMPRSDSEASNLSEYELFENLMFQPEYDNGNVWAVRVYTLGTFSSAVDLGLIYTDGAHQLVIGDTTLTIEISDNAISLVL